MFSKNLVLFIAILSCCFRGNKAKQLKTAYQYKEWDEDVEVYMTTPFAPRDNTLAYAVCEMEVGVCDVFIETLNYDNTTSSISCEVAVPLDDYVEVSNLVNDRIALYWVENNEKAVVHLVNVRKCVSRMVKFKVSPHERSKNLDVILHKDTFDVFYKEPKSHYPKSQQKTYNYKGKIVKGPIQSAEMEYHGAAAYFGRKASYRFPVEIGSPDKGYYCYYENEHVISAILIFPDNKKKELVTFELHTLHEVALSASNELFGMCYQYHQHQFVTCLQFNPVGTKIMNITHDNFQGVSMNSMRIYNLPNGGLLMITGRCHTYTDEHCTRFKDFFVQKFVNDDNKLFKKVKVKFNDELLRLQDISIFEQDEEFCLFAVYKNTWLMDKAFLNTIIKCFPKKLVDYIDFE